MRHQKIGRKFGRKVGDRKAFVRGLVYNLVMKEKITTTVARGKELIRVFGPFVTLAKKQDLASYRLLLGRLPKKAAEKLYKVLAARFSKRQSGFARLTRIAIRTRDASPRCIVALLEE